MIIATWVLIAQRVNTIWEKKSSKYEKSSPFTSPIPLPSFLSPFSAFLLESRNDSVKISYLVPLLHQPWCTEDDGKNWLTVMPVKKSNMMKKSPTPIPTFLSLSFSWPLHFRRKHTFTPESGVCTSILSDKFYIIMCTALFPYCAFISLESASNNEFWHAISF